MRYRVWGIGCGYGIWVWDMGRRYKVCNMGVEYGYEVWCMGLSLLALTYMSSYISCVVSWHRYGMRTREAPLEWEYDHTCNKKKG